MNPRQTEFQAYDRIANLRREAAAARLAADARAPRIPLAARLGGLSIRTAGRLRLVLRQAGV